MYNKIFSVIIFVLVGTIHICAQDIIIEGYTYASGNRGYISSAKIAVYDGETLIKSSLSNADGLFSIIVPKKDSYKLEIEHELYKPYTKNVDCSEVAAGEKAYVKAELRRSPGYLFEVTMAEEKVEGIEAVDAIAGARIDVYNNTTEEEVFVLVGHVDPHFTVSLIKGNHYTVLIRKEGFIAKRIEAFVDVEGCILCFEGLGTINPGVTDNLSEGNLIGVLLANVTLERAFSGKTIVLKDLYYDFGKAFLKSGAIEELNKLVRLMNDNPEIKVELGSHTDSRGSADKNMTLSERRAQRAVNYLIKKGIAIERIVSSGYGETQLRNECADGVNCSEKEHSYNRRTEIKILDINNSLGRVKSLAELKMMEKGEEELEEFAFGGQVKIEDESIEEVPQDETQANEAVDELVEEADQVSVIEQEVASDIPVNAGLDDIFYTVIIHESDSAISNDHELFKRHDSLEEIKLPDNTYKYVVGKYLSLKEAQKFFDTSIKIVYPDARLHKYQNGQLIE